MKYTPFILIPLAIWLGITMSSVYVPEPTIEIGAIPQTIEDKLVGKTARQRSNIKGQEIAKVDFRGQYVDTKYGIRIDIISIAAIDGGVEIFAKAWRDEKQLGFSKDGSVEIERFRFINPPILIDDPSGDVVRVINDPVTGEFVRNRKLREDPAAAIRRDLAHTISLVGKEDTDIVEGKVGNTVTTFRSVAGANSPVDGSTDRTIESGGTWPNTRTGDATAVNVTATIGLISAEKITSSFWVARHWYSTFDTSSIDDGDAIDSVVISFAGTGTAELNPDTTTIHILGATLAGTANLVVGDHDAYGATSFGSLATASWDQTDGTFNDFTLNTSGEGNISKTGVDEFAVVFNLSRADSPEPTGNNDIRFYSADDGGSGTTNDPTLVVTHTAGAPEAALIHNAFLYVKDGELRIKDGELRVKSE